MERVQGGGLDCGEAGEGIMQTLERAPKLPEPECSEARRPRRKLKATFFVERRYIGPLDDSLLGRRAGRNGRSWEKCGAYATKRGQLDAFRTMTNKGDWYRSRYEYRLADEADCGTAAGGNL